MQEVALLAAVQQALPEAQQPLMAQLLQAWRAQGLQRFEQAMQLLAHSLARLACARQPVPQGGALRERLRSLGSALGVAAAAPSAVEVAQAELARALDAEWRSNTGQLIALHGLAGQAQGDILQRVATHFQVRLRMDEGKAALWGGLVTGALAGLKADIASGGLTLGRRHAGRRVDWARWAPPAWHAA